MHDWYPTPQPPSQSAYNEAKQRAGFLQTGSPAKSIQKVVIIV